jgi:hypothetical protein
VSGCCEHFHEKVGTFIVVDVDDVAKTGYAMNSATLLALKTYSASAVESGDATASTVAASSAGNSAATPSVAGSSDGLVEVEKASLLRFTEDDRVHEVCFYILSHVNTQTR